MNIIQLTPGAGDMYCGNCLRDNALVAGYRRLGHDAIMVPLYLPLTLDEADLSAGSPIFFGGINVFLDQKASAFRSAPPWLRHWLSSPTLLRWLGRYAGKTRPADVAEMTLSMLRGESGNQARDLDEFMTWLRAQPRPDVLCISNALLLGMTQRLKAEIGAPIVCLLSGEDAFLDAMPDPLRGEIWATLVDRARSVDAFIAPSRYFADRMALRLQVSPDRVRVVPPGLNLAGFPTALRSAAPAPPVLGYFARMNRDKGLDTVVEVFIRLRQAGRIPGLKLKIGGSCGPADQPFVASLRDRLHSVGLLGDVEFHPNLTRPAKIAFLASLSVFCVPALFGEAFGLYLLEAMAAGIPVVQPNHAGFPDVLALTGGGVLSDTADATSLAQAVESLLLDPERRLALASQGYTSVHGRLNSEAVAGQMLEVFLSLGYRRPAGLP